MREKYIEQQLAMEVRRRGGICPKWVSPGFSGVPDRLVFLPGGKFGMVEVKATGGCPSPLQESRHRLFRKLGFQVYVIDSYGQIAYTLAEIGGSDG